MTLEMLAPGSISPRPRRLLPLPPRRLERWQLPLLQPVFLPPPSPQQLPPPPFAVVLPQPIWQPLPLPASSALPRPQFWPPLLGACAPPPPRFAAGSLPSPSRVLLP